MINGLVYSRGFPASYDKMAAMGNPGWSYQDVLPYFKKLEEFHAKKEEVIKPEYHGFKGPVSVGYFNTNRYENDS